MFIQTLYLQTVADNKIKLYNHKILGLGTDETVCTRQDTSRGVGVDRRVIVGI